jgi:predicted transcriptional regulator
LVGWLVDVSILKAELEGNTCDKVLHFIQEKPGCHLRQIKNQIGLSMGSVQYQLFRLEKMGKITSIRRGLYKFYFLSGVFHDNEKDILQVLGQETAREILMFIIERKNPTQTDIVNTIKISAPSVNWHVSRLIALKIIYETKDGKYKRYQLTSGNNDYSKYIVSLLKNYYPSIWDNWSNRLAEMFLSLSSREEEKEEQDDYDNDNDNDNNR